MIATLCFLLPVILLAIVLDVFFVATRQRYRELIKEAGDGASKSKLRRQAFLEVARGSSAISGSWGVFIRKTITASRLAVFGLEWLLIILVAYFYSGSLLNFDHSRLQQTGEQPESATLPILTEIGLDRYGEIPLWNPYMLTGFPHTGDFLGHLWNPVSTIPIALWGGINGMKVSIFLSFVIAGLGQWAFAYMMGLKRVFRLWSSILFMLSGGLALLWRIGWYELLLGAAWFPWCFALYLLTLKKHTFGSMALMSMAVFMVISTGGGYYPIYLLGCLVVLFLVMFWSSKSDERLKQVRTSVLTVLLSGALCAVVILPYMNVYRLAGRDVPPDTPQYFSQPIQYGLINYIVHTPEWFNESVLGTASGWNWFYIGWLPIAALAFVPLAFNQSPRRRWAMLLTGILFLILMMWFANRYSLFKKIYDWIPFLYNLRFPNRLLILAASPLLILSAHALEHSYRLSRIWAKNLKLVYSPAGKKGRAFPAHLVVTTLWILGLLVSTKGVYDVNQSFGFVDQSMDPKPMAALGWLKNYDPSLYYVNIGGGVIYWEWTPAAYELEMPVINFLYSRHLRTQDAQRTEVSPFIAQAKYQISLPDQMPPANAQQINDFGGVLVWEAKDVLPYAFSVQPALIQPYTKLMPHRVASVRVKLNGPNQVIARGAPTQDGDVLVVLMSNYPGWKLLIDGKPAPVQDYNGYLGAKMSPGEHLYQFYFLPADFMVGASISVSTLLLIAVVLFFSPIQAAIKRLRYASVPLVSPDPTI